MVNKSVRFLPIVLIAAVLVGCAGTVSTTYEAPGFEPNQLKRGHVAVGGMVLSSRLATESISGIPGGAPELLMDQADLWSPVLYEKFLAHGENTTVWPWVSTLDAVGDSLGQDILRTVARGGVLTPDRLREVAEVLEGARYLAVGRVDGNEVSLLEASPTPSAAAQDSRNPHSVGPRRYGKTRRKVTITLDIYDLKKKRSIWSSSANRRRDHLLSGDDEMLVEDTTPREEGAPLIENPSARLPAPPFIDVMGDAVGAAVMRLYSGAMDP